jgi:beta-galactosidase
MCEEDFESEPCTILKDGLGIEVIASDQPFASSRIDAFQYQDIPVRFVESCQGQFDEVFASRADEVVGFAKGVGNGRILVYGAAMTANTLDDIDIVDQMAAKMDCQPLFKLDQWADVRISRGKSGSFLFVNNYQDDPVETTIGYDGKTLFDGRPICIPARRGLILPLDWQVNEDVVVHYATAEIISVEEDSTTITLKTEPPHFTAELTATGYHCDGAAVVNLGNGRLKIVSDKGEIVLRRG